jgi:major inositol transporter-like SP family MFS transporter
MLQVGFGPISWLIISEIFPQSIRGQAVALAVQTNFFLNAVVQFGVPVLEARLGFSCMFGMFGVLTAYSIFFVYTRVPETKGLSLEEIEQRFAAMTMAGSRNNSAITGLRINSDEEKVQLIPTTVHNLQG